MGWAKLWEFFKQTATPSTPPSGYNKLYFKSDNKLYKLNSSGTEAEAVDLASPGAIGKTTPAEGWLSPSVAKGPAIITSFAGTVTASASTTVTFSSAADAILCGYAATNPILGATLISNALTRYIVSWTNSTTCVVDSSVTWAGTAITSVQLPISFEVTSAGVLQKATFADGSNYQVGKISIGKATPSNVGTFGGVEYHTSNDVGGLQLINWSTTDTNRQGMIFAKSGSNTIGTHTITAANEYIGDIFFYGSDGTAFREAACIRARIDGTPGSGDMPGRLEFNTTPDGSMSVALQLTITQGGNILTGGLAAAGTSAAKVLAMGSGTAPTTSPADAAQMWVADFLGTAGDARLHIMGEASAAGKIVLGSGKVGTTGTTGGLTRQFVEATANITANHTITITLSIPTGAKILGCQLRVDSALATGETWNAAYSGGNAQTIAHEEAVAANTKIYVPFDGLDTGGTLAAQAAWAAPITTATTNIAIQKHSNPGVDAFTAQGTIRAIVYYEAFDAMASL